MERTEIVVLLDRSGSMETAKSDHEGGLNSFVQDQRDLAGEVRFTLIQFDTDAPCEVVYDGVPVEEVQRCTLIPRGGTPLLDAIGKAVAHVRKRLDTFTGPVIFMIITDGEENSSREFKKEAVKKLIANREKAGWQFLFLGANVDAFAEAGGLGIAAGRTSGFANNHVGTESLYRNTSANLRRARTAYGAASCNAGPGEVPVADWAGQLTYTDTQRLENQGLTPANAPEKDTP